MLTIETTARLGSLAVLTVIASSASAAGSVAAAILEREPLSATASLSAATTFTSDPLTAVAMGQEAPSAASPAAANGPAPLPTAEGSVATSDAELAKKLSNPIANLISIPFQFNWDTGLGQNDADRLIVNIQPVIPITLTSDLNLILRTILPVVYVGSLANGVDSEFGLGDTTQSFFLSPVDSGIEGFVFGAGPVMYYPTATEQALGTGKWGTGPTAVALYQKSGWTVGALANQIWSFAGPSNRPDVNQMFVQPFVSYTFPSATSITLNSETTLDWEDSEWTVPINLMVAQVIRLGELPVQFLLGGRYYVESPDGGPEWGLRFAVTILLPR